MPAWSSKKKKSFFACSIRNLNNLDKEEKMETDDNEDNEVSENLNNDSESEFEIDDDLIAHLVDYNLNIKSSKRSLSVLIYALLRFIFN